MDTYNLLIFLVLLCVVALLVDAKEIDYED
jgi:hypothetical protein